LIESLPRTVLAAGPTKNHGEHYMKTSVMHRIRHAVLVVILGGVAGGLGSDGRAADLDLRGARWGKPVVTYWLGTGGGVSASARADVESAIVDWNAELSGLAAVAPVPTLVPASNRRRADIVFDLAVHEKLNRLGGTVNLQGSTFIETNGCEITTATISMFGTLMRGSPAGGTAIIRTFTRHLLGRVLGLGVMDCGGLDPCTTDLMDRGYVNFLYGSGFYDVDVDISDCDLDGILANYDPLTSCDEIPASIPYACD